MKLIDIFRYVLERMDKSGNCGIEMMYCVDSVVIDGNTITIYTTDANTEDIVIEVDR